jgi:hypothetical protein
VDSSGRTRRCHQVQNTLLARFRGVKSILGSKVECTLLQCVQTRVDHGADLNVKCGDTDKQQSMKWTPLPVASRNGRLEISRVLLKHGADPLIHAINFLAERLGIEIDGHLVFREGHVEVRVEHADDLRRLIVHDRAALLVPEYGHGEAARVAWVRVPDYCSTTARISMRWMRWRDRFARQGSRQWRIRGRASAKCGDSDGEGSLRPT